MKCIGRERESSPGTPGTAPSQVLYTIIRADLPKGTQVALIKASFATSANRERFDFVQYLALNRSDLMRTVSEHAVRQVAIHAQHTQSTWKTSRDKPIDEVSLLSTRYRSFKAAAAIDVINGQKFKRCLLTTCAARRFAVAVVCENSKLPSVIARPRELAFALFAARIQAANLNAGLWKEIICEGQRYSTCRARHLSLEVM